MRIEPLFRLIVVIGFLMAIMGATLDAVIPDAVPRQLSDAYESFSNEALDANWYIAGALALVCGIGIFIATVGLYLFKPWARTAAVVVTIAALPLYVLLGPIVQSGWATMLIESSSTLWGVVLAMAYFSPLSERFQSIGRH